MNETSRGAVRPFARALGVLAVVLTGSSTSAASIADALGLFVNQQVGLVVRNVRFPNIAGELLEREALGSLQLPVPAASTGFTYALNPDLTTFERLPGSLAPVFTDRAETIGERRFNLQFTYQFADLTDFDGKNFGRQLQFALVSRAEDVSVGGIFLGRSFSLAEHVFSFSGTYGLTSRWDVNLLVPFLYTTLDLEGVAGGFVDSTRVLAAARFHDDAFGIGDLQLRSRYRFVDDADLVSLAAAVSLRFPSGRMENFQGLGDFTITPTLIASRALGRHDVHASVGMELNTMDAERTRARYAIGAVVQAERRLAVVLDVLGSSGLDDDRFTIATGNVTPVCKGVIDCVNYTATAASVQGIVPRSDVVDLSAGFKLNPFASANIYVLAIVPLTQQGLRAAVVPAGGVEWTF